MVGFAFLLGAFETRKNRINRCIQTFVYTVKFYFAILGVAIVFPVLAEPSIVAFVV